MTLTLPIEIGKKYVRRDGVVVTAKQPIGKISAICDIRMDDKEKLCEDYAHVWLENGRVRSNVCYGDRQTDLVADYIEPVKVTGHPHAARMAEYAEDAKVSAEPWRGWQFCDRYSKGEWIDLICHPYWDNGEFRRKPKMITIVGVEVSYEHILAARAEIEALFASVEQSK